MKDFYETHVLTTFVKEKWISKIILGYARDMEIHEILKFKKKTIELANRTYLIRSPNVHTVNLLFYDLIHYVKTKTSCIKGILSITIEHGVIFVRFLPSVDENTCVKFNYRFSILDFNRVTFEVTKDSIANTYSIDQYVDKLLRKRYLKDPSL